MQEVMSADVALEEVNKWLDARRVKQKDRESKKVLLNALVDAFVNGDLVLDEDSKLIQKLQFPIKSEAGETIYSELKYKIRVQVGALNEAMRGIANPNGMSTTMAYVGAITDCPKSIIEKLDMSDYTISSAIASFFM